MQSKTIHHDACLFLEGTWVGKGTFGDSLVYDEEIEVKKIKPNIFYYQQNTKDPQAGVNHSESGYFRIFMEESGKEGKVELVLSHSFGACEVSEGTLTDKEISLKVISSSLTSSAIQPYAAKMTRKYVLKDEDTISFIMDLDTKTGADSEHVEGELKRVKK